MPDASTSVPTYQDLACRSDLLLKLKSVRQLSPGWYSPNSIFGLVYVTGLNTVRQPGIKYVHSLVPRDLASRKAAAAKFFEFRDLSNNP
jgi:hypothetical protein